MARAVNVLSARRVATIMEPGRHADGGGLYLVVDESGAKRWVFLYRFQGKRREMGLGGVIAVPLAAAREKAAAARLSVANGIDPINAAKAESSRRPTFAEAAKAFIDDRAPSWRNEIHQNQWRTTLETYAKPISATPVDRIDTNGVLACIRPIWSIKPETASRVRGRIERILDAQKAAGNREGENPARWRGHLEMILPKPAKLKRGHHASMPYSELPAFIVALQAREAAAARMLEFLILTAARSGEVRKMCEGNVKGDVWTVPAAQMKAKREHRVPLVPRALEILKPFRRDEAGALLFPNSRKKAHSDMVFTALMKRMKVDAFTAHGFRASFKTWAENETTHQREVIEAALAHVIGDKAEQAYRRSDMLAKRRALLHDWATFLASGSDSR